ncbi:MAG: protease pro-enzyme activation domain-containing protein, partial [Actinomycetota bacterium]|nr:protease pro-enzyme activation domain-containing protein [Actinomycetota bacterium]
MGTRSWRHRWVALAGVVGGLAVGAPAALAAGPVERLGAAPGGQGLSLVLPLRANLSGLQRFATAVSTVGSPQYRQYAPIAVLARRFGASAADRARVRRFLRHAGANHIRIDATGLFADARLSVSRAERLFGAPLARFAGVRAQRYLAPT